MQMKNLVSLFSRADFCQGATAVCTADHGFLL